MVQSAFSEWFSEWFRCSVVSSEILGKWRRGGQSSLPSDRVGLFDLTIGVYIRVYKSVWYTLDHCIKSIESHIVREHIKRWTFSKR